MEISNDESGQILRLAGKLDIRAAEELRHALYQFVGEKEKSAIDLSAVETCDTAALQLIFSARKTVEGLGRRFELAGMSEAVRDTSAVLGLSLVELPAHAS